MQRSPLPSSAEGSLADYRRSNKQQPDVPSGREGVTMPLSEDEQRILQEMEQTLREHDRQFVARVNQGSHRLDAAKGAKWSILGFIAGFVLLASTFRFSIVLGALGYVLMLVSALLFAQHVRHAGSGSSRARTPRRLRSNGLSDELSEMRRRMRSRFGHHD